VSTRRGFSQKNMGGKKMPIARKMSQFIEKSSWIRKMFEEGAKLKAQYGAENVFDFSLGNPNLDPPADFTKVLIAYLNESRPMKHGYMPNAGFPEVRKHVAEYLNKEQGIDLTENEIIMTCGAGGGLNVVLKAILNPGEIVLCSSPYFVEYIFYVDNHGGKLETIPSLDDFDLDVDLLASKIDPNTAAVLINSPNNPTGRVYSAERIQKLANMLRDKEKDVGRAIYLISDEPYRKIVYDKMNVPSVITAYENSIVVNSYSKDLSLAGERIGFISVNPKSDDLKQLMSAMILANRILGFVNAPASIQQAVGRLQGLSVDIGLYERKRDMLCDGLASIGYQFFRPQGAFYLFPQSPIDDDVEFCRILQQEKILAVPGRGFGRPGHFRLAYCVDDIVIDRSMPAFQKAWGKI
jgi:aspartate aminotransferase